MLVRYLDIEGLLLLCPRAFTDERGHSFESWNEQAMDIIFDLDSDIPFVQENQSRSKRNVIRGLHYQLAPYAQGKLVRCVAGSIYDVAVDLRVNSPTYKQWVGINLTSENRMQLYIPPGFAHGFLSTSKFADVIYKTTNLWDPDSERSIRWNDKTLNINWPLSWISNPILSEKDKKAPSLKEAEFAGDVFQ